MKTRRLPMTSKQRGSVAMIFGLSVIALFAMGGLVLDLGHLYVAKAELQNAADSAALAGAKDLNQTASGIDTAVNTATQIAQKNQYNFSTAVTLTAANIQFGPSPDGPWYSQAVAKDSPQGKTFIKVDTGQKTLNTFLMRVAGFSTVNTSGIAVAGRFVNDITPLGVCAVDPANKTAKYTYSAPAGTGITEIVEFGFRRGVTYNLFGMNPLSGGPSDPYLINPVDTPPGGCSASHSSASFTAPFMCTGGSAVLATGTGTVYTNTGLTASLAASLNSRFDDYSSPSVCDPTSAPPDTNIKEYPCKGNGDPACVNNSSNIVSTTPPINWMEPGGTGNLPNVEFVALNSSNKPNYALPSATSTVPVPNTTSYAQFSNYGVLWSYGPAYQADSSTPPKASNAITPSQANLNPMYSFTATSYFDTTSSSNYPTTVGSGFPASTPPAPYNQTSGPYFQAPSASHPGVRNRRVLNVVLVDCRTAPVGSSSCGAMTAVGIGKFFMPVKADFTGGPNRRLDVEFAGLIEPVPTSEIKLYR